jgi:O-antigen ligase
MLPLVISFYQLGKGRVVSLIHILIFTPFFLAAYSRSAYLAVVLVLGMIIWENRFRIQLNKWLIGTSVSFVLVASLLFFAITDEAKQIPVLSLVHENLKDRGDLKYKSIDGRRWEYLGVSLKAFKESPFGVGTGNYIEVSKKFLVYKYKTDTAHNIFLEILVENGVLALIFFILFIYEFFRNSIRNVYHYLSFVMLINFQFDYGYRIYSFFFLLIVCLYLSQKGREEVY